MELSRTQKVKYNRLNQRFDALKGDYEDVFNQLNYKGNAQEQNNLKRQLDDIEKEMAEVEEEIKALEQAKIGTEAQSLIAILMPIDEQKAERLRAAYQACRPSGWEDSRPDTPNTIKELLADLEDMPPGDSGYKPLFQFVAYLALDSEIPLLLRQPLQQWLHQEVNNVSRLQNQIKQQTDPEHFYLMVWIQPSQQKSDRYFIKAWLAFVKQPDAIESEYECEPLSISKAEEEAFPLNQIPLLLKEILVQSSSRCALSDLTIEFFLPRHLLNHEFDRWEIEITQDLLIPIGVECKVVLRSEERLLPNYCLKKNDWKKKWKKLKELNYCSSSSAFASGECAWNQLYIELNKKDIVGCKLSKAPDLSTKENIFNVILGTATPLALWVRGNLVHLNCPRELDRLLNCRIIELPTMVKGERATAFSSTLRGMKIGSHLSLLWEDPYRLPPTINYSTP
jgi:hypothetical protein